jgi:hypothetical protein
VETQLEFIDHRLVHLSEGTYCWVDIKRFHTDIDTTDRELLEALIAHDQYHDHYAGHDVAEQTHHSLHGPYRLECITAGTFTSTTANAANARLATWAENVDPNSPMSRDIVKAEVLPLLADGRLYELPDLGQAAQHSWGFVVGVSGFLEFIHIDPHQRILGLFVASDD